MTVAAMERVTDWVNDRLPAVLVKEVRQGLSRSVFLIEFYGFHVVLACITLWQMAEAQQYEDFGGLARSSGTRGVFWFLMALYMIIIVPLMNINAVASEVTGRTIELMKMSGLSARKIVWGKWLYQCLYLAMITLSTFPYLFSYYLVAGGDLMMEVRLMLGLGFGSILVTGLAIGISPIGSSRFRPMIFLGLMIFLFAGGVQLFSYFFGFRRGVSFGDSALTLFLLGTPLTLFALELGTAKISSRVEGNALAIRLIGLVLVGVPGLMILGNLNAEFATGFASGAIVIIPWSVMLTQPVLAAGAYGQYLKYGYFGRFMGRLFFYPGWVSGVMYCTVLIGLYDIMILLLNHSVSDGDKLEMMYVFNALAMLPLQLRLARELLQKNSDEWPTVRLLLIHIALLVVIGIIGAMRVYGDLNLMSWTSFLPLNAFCYAFYGAFRDPLFELQASVAAFGQISIIVGLLLLGQKVRYRYQELEDEAEQLKKD